MTAIIERVRDLGGPVPTAETARTLEELERERDGLQRLIDDDLVERWESIHATYQMHRRAAAYRHAVSELMDANPETLQRVQDQAEFTGDFDLSRAVGAVAYRRGMHDIALRHVYMRGEAIASDSAKLSMLPTDSTVASIVGSMRPRTPDRNEIEPTPKAKRECEQAENNREMLRQMRFRR